jgi:sec-independent protein translocase protein TatC
MAISALITLEAHIEFMATMMMFFGLCFQMPAVILAMAEAGLASVKSLNHYRCHVVVGIFVLAAVLTPSPSPLDQIALAIPMWLMYELGVVLSYFLVGRKRRRA